ncbi:MAG: S41 family peptidase, partial [Actinomycetota bacterium]
EQASDKKSFVKTLAALASLMNDSHVGLWNQHTEIFGTHGPPIGLRYIEDKICVARVHPDASEMDINRGDEITHLDDRPIRDAANDLSRMISASTHSALNRSLFNRSWIMFGEQDSELVIDTKRGSRKKKVHLHRSLAVGDWVPEPSSDAVSRRLSSGVGYINLDSVESSEEFDKALRKLRSCPGLILDMRGYPRFGVQWDVVSRLIDVPVKGTQFLIPRRFAGSGQHSYHWSQYEIAPHKKLSYTGPLVVLIDENAQSASEDFCIYLQNAHRVTFVGSETSGTNGNVTTVNLGSGIGLTFTGMRVLFGNGSRFQNIGITPDVESLPTIKGWLAGRDEVLEAGEKILLQRAKKKPADGSSKTT